MNPILPIGQGVATKASFPLPTQQPGVADGKSGFLEIAKQLTSDANQQQLQAEQSVEKLLSGETQDLQNVVMSMAKADLSFRLIVEVRNKLMDAYQEIMRMQV